MPEHVHKSKPKSAPRFAPAEASLLTRSFNPQQNASEQNTKHKLFGVHSSQTPFHAKSAPCVQARLTINIPNDKYEQEADRVADQVMRMPLSAKPFHSSPIGSTPVPRIQRMCAECEDELQRAPSGARNETPIQTEEQPRGALRVPPDITAGIQSIKGSGATLPGNTQSFFESRFGHSLSGVRIHNNARAHQLAKSIHARAFTLGKDIVFGSGQYQAQTHAGRHLLAHELVHTIQQNKASTHISRSTMEVRPAVHTPPCACLVFIHNNEQNARIAAENLQRNCRYNLAIVPDSGGRRIPAEGLTRADTTERDGDLFTSDGVQVNCAEGRRGACTVDPNELFSPSVRTECTGDIARCRTRARGTSFRALQSRFFLAVRDCSNNFQLPTVAIHNNVIAETARYRESLPGIGHRIAGVMEDIDRDTTSGRGSREDLRQRLGQISGQGSQNFRRLMTREGTSNIFRWCNLPEIRRCHIGDPFHPDNLVWVTTDEDFERLNTQPVNVVQQESVAGDTGGGESETDLSTMYERLGPRSRYINIETPHQTPGRADDQNVRRTNMTFILQTLTRLGLNCCDTDDSG